MSAAGEAKPPVRVVRDAAEAGRLVADLLVEAARAAVAARGEFFLAIPGGSSPRSVFEELARPARLAEMPWERAHLLWVDERAVAIEHPDSNYGAFARDILTRLPLDAARVHRMRGELGPHDGALDYRRRLTALLGPGPDGGVIDVVLLGVGEDGHIASLFPGSPSLEARDSVIGITDSPKPPPGRITLTIPVFRAARRLVVLGLGAGKADVVGRSLSGEPLPARMASQGPNSLWVIDAAASARRSPGAAAPLERDRS